MSFSITFCGGSLIMMGYHTRSESLFYYFRLEDHIPEDHLLAATAQNVKRLIRFLNQPKETIGEVA